MTREVNTIEVMLQAGRDEIPRRHTDMGLQHSLGMSSKLESKLHSDLTRNHDILINMFSSDFILFPEMEEMSVVTEGHTGDDVMALDNHYETVHQHLDSMFHLLHFSVSTLILTSYLLTQLQKIIFICI